MKNRLIPCVLACLMIFLVGCNGNTAKEAAQEITKTETSFPANLMVFFPEEVADCFMVFSALSTVLIAELVFCEACFLKDCSARCCLKR